MVLPRVFKKKGTKRHLFAHVGIAVAVSRNCFINTNILLTILTSTLVPSR